MKLPKFFVMILLAAVVLAACAPVSPNNTSTQTPVPPTPVENQNLPPKAVLAAQQDLAGRMGIPVDQIQIRSIEQVQWPNACLGAQKPDEMCAEVIVDGYKVIFAVENQTYEYHTNMEGDQFRAVEQAAGGKDLGGSIPPAAEKARQVLAVQLGRSADEIELVSVEAVEWPNSCLGVEQPGLMCAQVITPGYKIVFEADGSRFIFHTDEAGGAIVQAQAALPNTAETVITWERTTDGVCSQSVISFQSVAYGACGGASTSVPLEEARAVELAEMVARYSAFDAETKSGLISFQGGGQEEATEAEQRSLAAWADLVRQEAESGRTGAAWGIAFTWQREGGIAGFCDDLVVYQTGWAEATSCKSSTAAPKAYRLDAAELEQLYAWLDAYGSFEFSQSDGAVADSMKVALSFQGTGDQQPDADQQIEIASFARQVYTRAAR